MGELLIAERQDLQDIANKLKAKTGRTDKISFPNGFMDIVDSLGTGSGTGSGESNLQEKIFYSNGTYAPDSGYDGFNKIIVLAEGADGDLPIAEEASF